MRMQIMLWFGKMFVICISLSVRLLLLSSSLDVVDSAGQHSQVITGNNSKRTAASNRLIQGHLAGQSNAASSIELLEMKEKICAGFMFRASGINCTFQIPKQSLSISAVFVECRPIMINRCRRKQSEFFCEKGKQNAMKINRQTPLISRLIDRVEASTLPTIDCFLSDQDRFAPIYGSAIQSYGKCCSICQKGKLYAIELSSCKHKFYTDAILEQTFNDCCYSRLYQNRLDSASVSISSNDYLANNEDRTAAQLTSQLIHAGSEIDSLISSGTISNMNNIPLISLSSLTSSSSTSNNALANNNGLSIMNQQINQPIGQQMMQSNRNNMIPTYQNLNSNIRTSSIGRTNDIFQQLQLNVDIEKVYLSKAKLMLSLRRNETLITNLTDEERRLVLKALDTSNLDYTIKRLTNIIQNKDAEVNSNMISGLQSGRMSNVASSNPSNLASSTDQFNMLTSFLFANSLNASTPENDLQNESLNRPSTASNLIDQLQLLLANSKWINNSTLDHHYSNLATLDEAGSSVDDDLETLTPIEDEIV